MAMRVETMSILTTPPSESLRSTLLRKLLLLILVIVTVTLGLAILFRQHRTVSPLLLAIFADAVLGLVAGFSARLVLRKHSRLLRFTAALAALVAGLALLGLLTGWHIGIGPLEFGRRSVDWFSLGQLSIGIGVGMLSLQAWQHPAPVGVRPAVPPPSRKSSRSTKQPRKRPRRPAVLPPGRKPSRSTKRPHKRPRRAASPRIQPARPVAVFEQPVKPKRKRVFHRKPALQLSNEEEHRCPYCLEMIKPNDPRGVVECDVCHTKHHADCWAITGTCQVPHLNA